MVTGDVTLTAATTGFTDGVRLLRNGKVVTEITKAPFVWPLSLTSKDNGIVAFEAVARRGTTEVHSKTVNVTVALETVPPVVSLSAMPASFSAPGTVTLTAVATDNVGVTKVEFLKAGIVVATKTSAPYTFAAPITAGDDYGVAFSARAYDAAGNQATSDDTMIAVSIPTWTKSWADKTGAVVSDMSISSGDDVVVGGGFAGAANTSPAFVRKWGKNGVVQYTVDTCTKNGAGGTQSRVAAVGDDVWHSCFEEIGTTTFVRLIHIDPAGVAVSTETLAVPYVPRLASDGTSLYVAGTSSVPYAPFVEKRSATGKVLWHTTTFSGTGNDATALAIRGGHVVVATRNDGGSHVDTTLSRFDAATGAPIAANILPSTTCAQGTAVAIDSSGVAYESCTQWDAAKGTYALTVAVLGFDAAGTAAGTTTLTAAQIFIPSITLAIDSQDQWLLGTKYVHLDSVVEKRSSAGVVAWADVFLPNQVATDSQNNVYVLTDALHGVTPAGVAR